MAALIDTSVLVAAERGRLDLDGWLRGHAGESIAICAVTLSELWLGVHRARPGRRRADREIWVRTAAERFPVVPFDTPVALVHAALWADLAVRGALIGAHDLLIAATGVAHRASVVTLNVAEFLRVRGLTVVDPSAP